jgi:hypothetical protein
MIHVDMVLEVKKLTKSLYTTPVLLRAIRSWRVRPNSLIITIYKIFT